MSAARVELVRFRGDKEHSAVPAGTTAAGLKKQIRTAESAGLNVKFRGARDALRAAGALPNADGMLCLHVGALDYCCLVTEATS